MQPIIRRLFSPQVIITLIYPIFVIISQWDTFTLGYSINEYESMYSNSQYIQGENSTKLIGDGDLYVYAGIRYLSGEDPTKINFEHPPFGKILLGLSYLVFNYPNLVLIPLFLIALYYFWQLNTYLIKSRMIQY